MSRLSQNNAEEKLHLAQRTIESILKSITGCFFVLDKNWRILHLNHPTDVSLPHPREQLLGKTLWEVYPHWKSTAIPDLLHRALFEKDTIHFEFLDKKNSKWYEMYAFHLSEGLSIHFHDISSRKEVEERLRLSYEEIEGKIEERTRQLVQSNQALQAGIGERKRVEREILEITQEEQRRFGLQLHDGLCQELTAILVFAKGLAQKMEKDKRLDIAELEKISDLLHGAVDQARNTARGLYPGELKGSSLMHTLEELTSSTQNLSGISCRLHCPDPILINDNDIANHLYKIAQEGVNNAITHAQPQSIEVSLTERDGLITLSVKDDGIGFIPNPENPNGIGLKIMKYRAHLMGASFHVEPNLPHGVILKCILKIP